MTPFMPVSKRGRHAKVCGWVGVCVRCVTYHFAGSRRCCQQYIVLLHLTGLAVVWVCAPPCTKFMPHRNLHRDGESDMASVPHDPIRVVGGWVRGWYRRPTPPPQKRRPPPHGNGAERISLSTIWPGSVIAKPTRLSHLQHWIQYYVVNRKSIWTIKVGQNLWIPMTIVIVGALVAIESPTSNGGD